MYLKQPGWFILIQYVKLPALLSASLDYSVKEASLVKQAISCTFRDGDKQSLVLCACSGVS